MSISIPQSVKNTLATYNEPEDFMRLRVTPLQDQKTAHLEALHTSQRLSLWPALQDPAALLPIPLTRTQSTLNSASPAALMITVSSTRVPKTLHGTHKDPAMPPILEDLHRRDWSPYLLPGDQAHSQTQFCKWQ
jgi:hypothetical protein